MLWKRAFSGLFLFWYKEAACLEIMRPAMKNSYFQQNGMNVKILYTRQGLFVVRRELAGYTVVIRTAHGCRK